MHPFAECPEWEYKDEPRHTAVLAAHAASILLQIHSDIRKFEPLVFDSRPIHAQLFSSLVPKNAKYLAGHYRGENFKCLKHRPVGIAGNPVVGVSPELVQLEMLRFAKEIKLCLFMLDATFALPDAQLPPPEKLKYLVAVAARLFSDFLQIHPYANGNGHAGRILLTWFLARYDYWMQGFPIDPRPPLIGYDAAIYEYQKNGTVEPLETLIFKAIIS